MPDTTLRHEFKACAILLGLDQPPTKLRSPSSATSSSKNRQEQLNELLQRRLDGYHALIARGEETRESLDQISRQDELERETARAALRSLANVNELLQETTSRKETAPPPTPAKGRGEVMPPPPPKLSVKDNQVVSQLAGIVARWGIARSVAAGILPTSLMTTRQSPTAPNKGKIVEILEEETIPDGQGRLEHFVHGVLELIGPRADGEMKQLIIPQVLLPLIGGLVQLSKSTTKHVDKPPRSEYQNQLDALLGSRPPTVIIPNLLAILSTFSTENDWIKPTIANLLSRQLLRTGGVRSLLVVVVGVGSAAGSADHVDTRKMDLVMRLLRARSGDVEDEDYYSSTLHQLFDILDSAIQSSLDPSSSKTPPPPATILRITVYVLSHFIITPPHPSCALFTSKKLYAACLPFDYSCASPSSVVTEDDVNPPAVTPFELLSCLTRLSWITLYAPPSYSSFLVNLLSPILATLLSLYTSLNPSLESTHPSLGAADPRFDEETKALLQVWNKSIVGCQTEGNGMEFKGGLADEGVKIFSRAIERMEKGEVFGFDNGGREAQFVVDPSAKGGIAIRVLEPLEVKQREEEANLDSIVDAQSVVGWLKECGNGELNGALLIRWLDELSVLGREKGFEGAKKSLTRLQLVLQMVEEMGSEILKNPEQLVGFVAHALEDDEDDGKETKDTGVKTEEVNKEESPSIFKLNLIDDDPSKASEEDNGEEPIIPGVGADEMRLTALTLLLALLEANESISPSSNALMSTIYEKLDSIAEKSKSELVPSLAREAKLVLSAREALHASTTVGATESKAAPYSESRKTYQLALRYLQDPLLPVRAQGLSLLRTLVHSGDAFLKTDPALVPAVLDIFVQSLSEEDSFLYLNAIQGLSSLADVYGKQIVRRLLMVYRGGSSEGIKAIPEDEGGRAELDKRLRMAETLTQVIERAGQALSILVADLVPTLLVVLRGRDLPTPLRSSALTVLASCVEVEVKAVKGWVGVVVEACLTLLSIESRPLRKKRQVQVEEEDSSSDDDEEERTARLPNPFKTASDNADKNKRPEETPDPTSKDTNHPAFRRSALLFLSLTLRSIQKLKYAAIEEGLDEEGYDEKRPFGKGGMKMPNSGTGGIKNPIILSKDVFVSAEQAKKEVRNELENEWDVDLGRIRVVLEYVKGTDEDGLVRHQAGQVLEEVEAFYV
ncbi:BZ3500_MvSof-1268-A1-R1_Chr4-1g06816 [Microbotryum saponariae]|uniref:BZ3500_MvSof-1268-A1-R1_Chr4-1g06816 protein n=1 Tax=Microbotryum saponariae TaxID=289078 RepID=A0A2X0LL34_9BASI|nr:BZ3500_MvSof-1268-A1-R1_Chr4-1g06816 [Microbotryum saponariae]SDA06473.1 BZ3501_MvSof-1269-A2-R1_Chr4-1g06518 [Microbotryum saponariae]